MSSTKTKLTLALLTCLLYSWGEVKNTKGAKAMRIDRWKVKQQMKIVGIRTFGELAERVGVSQAAMSAWFRGAAFSSGSLEALLRELQCTPNDILTLDPNRLAPVAQFVPVS